MLGPAPGSEQLVAERPRRAALQLDPGLLADAQERALADLVSGGSIGSARSPSASSVATRAVSAAAAGR
jgi:hypothetical protein